MLRYVIRRLLWVVVLLLLVSFVTFVIFYTLPSGDPAALRAGRQPNPDLVRTIRHQLGLDRPWPVQYWLYMKKIVLHFDFGYSYQNSAPVRQQIFDRLPATISLTAGAAVVWLLIGLPVGIVSAIPRPQLVDPGALGAGPGGVSAPGCRAGLGSAFPLFQGNRRDP